MKKIFSLLFLCTIALTAKAQFGSAVITTVAGDGIYSFLGDYGPAINAEFENPNSLVEDKLDNLYITDCNNNRIRKINIATGIITTIAGNGTAGFSGDNGPATAAQLNRPTGLVFDGNGNLLIADNKNNRIRKITIATGVITTIAGSDDTLVANFGDGGPATIALLNNPYDVAVGSDGAIYISDQLNNRIRKIDTGNGIITTYAGNGNVGSNDGSATSANLNYPAGICLAANDDLFIADSKNNKIRKVSGGGTPMISTVVGTDIAGFSGDGSAAINAQLYQPTKVIIDSANNLYIADQFNNSIREVYNINGTTPKIITIAGNGHFDNTLQEDGVPATNAALMLPSGICINGSTLYIADCYKYKIKKIDSTQPAITGFVDTVFVGDTLSLKCGTGGIWKSDNTSLATVNPFSGLVTGVKNGIDTISYTYTSDGTKAIFIVYVIDTPSVITSTTSPICTGNVINFTDSIPGGTWTSSGTSIATINLITGTLTAVSAGIVTLTYTLHTTQSSAYTTKIITVNPNPAPISSILVPPFVICEGVFDTLYSSPPGTWFISNTSASKSSYGDTCSVHGISAGIDTITYIIPSGCFATQTITINTAPKMPITNLHGLCVGTSDTLMDSVFAHYYLTNSNTSILSITPNGIITGLDTGTVYITDSACGSKVFDTINVHDSLNIYVPQNPICAGSNSETLTSDSHGGHWYSSIPSDTIDGVTGIFQPITAGLDTIMYIGTPYHCIATKIITVNTTPNPLAPILGNAVITCGQTITLTDATIGGTWSCSNAILSVNPLDGVITPVNTAVTGIDIISYSVTNTNGCGPNPVTKSITFNPATLKISYDPAMLCAGHTILFSSYQPNNTPVIWSSSNSTIATISPDGQLTPTIPYTNGTITISYTVPYLCNAMTVTTYIVTVDSTPTIGTISGYLYLCNSSTTTLSVVTTGVTTWKWKSIDPTIATIDSMTGVVTGIKAGATDSIFYTATNQCGSTTQTITVGIGQIPQTPHITEDLLILNQYTTECANTMCHNFRIRDAVPQDANSYYFWKSLTPDKDTIYMAGKDSIHCLVDYINNGDGNVTVIDTNTLYRCSSMDSFSIQIKPANSTQFGYAYVAIGLGYTLVCYNNDVEDMITTYQWGYDYVNDSLEPVIINSLGTFQSYPLGHAYQLDLDSGKYYWVEISNGDNGCSEKLYVNDKKPSKRLSNPQTKSIDNIIVYPNPSNGVFTIKLPTTSTKTDIYITDMAGRAVYQHSFDNNRNTINIAIDNLTSNGNYLLNVKAEGTMYHQLITINRK